MIFLGFESEVTRVADVWQRFWREGKFGLDSYMRYFWREHLAYIMPVLRKLRGSLSDESRVIDVGVGTGSLLKLIHEAMQSEVVGLDISRNALGKAKLRFSPFKSKSSVVLGDVFHLPFRNGTFDVALCLGLIEHFKDSITPMSNVLKIVKEGGFAFISVPQRKSLYTPYKNWQIRRKTWPFGFEKEFTVNELREIFEKLGLPKVKIVGVDFYPSFLKIIPFEMPFRPIVVRIAEYMEKRIRDPLQLAHMLMIIAMLKTYPLREHDTESGEREGD